mgnify:CR=1 FL=1
MRMCERNKIEFWYALFKKDTADYETEEQDYLNGGHSVEYETPVKIRGNVSPESGTISVEPYGVSAVYSRQVFIEDKECPITEGTFIWLDKTPEQGKYNYIVISKSVSLNHVAYTLRKVE